MSKAIAVPKSARSQYLRQLQATILRLGLHGGDLHADQVVDALPVPGDVHANTVGAAFSGLEAAGLIQAVGFERSIRASRHRGVSRAWRVCDAFGARGYLRVLANSGDDL